MANSIKVESVVYNRNGVSGYGFYSVKFTSVIENGEKVNFIAVVDVRDADANGKTIFDESAVYVITPNEIESCWRGSYFADAVIKAIKRFQRKQDKRWAMGLTN